ncbi:hypothetical protein KQS06HV_50806 [Klebsiella quasipneumoniae subsp. similipneumoniae]|nr:hypothetical protein KQS06HV_50806 [Klebsiella quasipneumoniae subsp. similipneumoniae]
MPDQRLLRRRSQRTVDNAQSIAHGLQLSAISYQLSAISYQLQLQLQPSAAKASEKT